MVSTLAIVVLLVACGGLSLAIVSSRAHVKDVMIHHEALVNELTHTKNHLHQIEVRAAGRRHAGQAHAHWARQQRPHAVVTPSCRPGRCC